MIIALLGYLLFGGGDGFNLGVLSRVGIEQLVEQIEVTVADTERRDAALSIIESVDELVKASEETNSNNLAKLRTLYKDHSSKSEQLLAVVDDVAAGWESLQKSELDARFELKSSLSEDEWAQVFAAR